MRKFLGTAAAAALLLWAGAPANADLLKNVQTSGSIEVQGRGISNATDLNSNKDDYQGKVGTRLGAGLMFDLNDDVSARLSIYKNDRAWGTGAQTLDNTGTNLGVLNTVTVGEANILLKNVIGLNHTIGRQYYNDGGDVVIRFGPSGSHVIGLPTTAIDGWRFDWSNDKWLVHGIFAKTTEAPVPAGTNGFSPAGYNLGVSDKDTDVEGIEAMFSWMKALNLGARLYNVTITNNAIYGGATDLDSHSQLASIRAKGELMAGLSYTAEVMQDFGDSALVPSAAGGRASQSGTGALANAEYNGDAGAVKFKVLGEFGWGEGSTTDATKTFQTINSDYRPGLIWGGLSSLAGTTAGSATGLGGYNTAGLSGTGGSGLTTFNVGAKVNPAAWDRLWLGAHFYDFMKSAGTATPAGAAGGVGSTSKSLGDEIDVTATWKQSDMTSVRFGYAWFMPGAGLGSGDNITMASADVSVRF